MPRKSSSELKPNPINSNYLDDVYLSDSENPFRPEGELAHEADEYVREFVTKKQQQLDQSLRSTSSINNNASKSASLLNATDGHGSPNSPSREPQQSQSPELASTPKSASKKEKKAAKNGSAHNNNTSTNNPSSPVNQDADDSKKKVKSKCGCVIS